MGVIMDKELIDEINYEIQLLIKSGFYGDDDILEIISDEFIEEDISDDLISKLKANPSYIFSLIQKFNKDDITPLHTDYDILLISDEAHRTQNGVFANNMCKLLPEASRIGFTGTPLFSFDNITQRTFGDYVSIYDFKRAVDDGATVPLYYENRGEKLNLDNPEINEKLLEAIEEIEDDQKREKVENLIKKELHLIRNPKRLDRIAKDFVNHYSDIWQTGKAMFVSVIPVTCPSVFVVIVGTLVDVHLEVYAVCVANADWGVYHNAVVTSQLVIPVINPAQLVKSQVSVGTEILAVTLLEALAVNVFTVVQFFWIVNVALFTVGNWLVVA